MYVKATECLKAKNLFHIIKRIIIDLEEIYQS